jgi:two-component system response regulator VanR
LNLEYNIDERELNGVRMTKKEADIMHELMKTPEKVVKKEYLLNKVWGGEAYGEDNYIEVYMSGLRKLLKTLHSEAKIMTVRGFGYKLIKE